MRNKAQKESRLIYQMLEELHSSYYSFHIQEEFIILCQSSDDPEISKTLSDFMRVSMKYFVNNLEAFPRSEGLSTEEFHRRSIANFILSCREFVQEGNMAGSCAFGICYKADEQVFCVRSEGIEVFLLDETNRVVKPINKCLDLNQAKRSRNKRIESYYFSADMQKIKAQFIYETSDYIKKKVFFQSVSPKKFGEGNLKLLMGCSETFDLISSDILFKHFESGSKRSDCEKINRVLEEAKKNVKSVHRQDLSMACWKIPNPPSQPRQP